MPDLPNSRSRTRPTPLLGPCPIPSTASWSDWAASYADSRFDVAQNAELAGFPATGEGGFPGPADSRRGAPRLRRATCCSTRTLRQARRCRPVTRSSRLRSQGPGGRRAGRVRGPRRAVARRPLVLVGLPVRLENDQSYVLATALDPNRILEIVRGQRCRRGGWRWLWTGTGAWWRAPAT